MTKNRAKKEQVIRLLDELFRNYGYYGVSLSLIGKTTGLGKGSIYNFFPNGKEEMLSEVVLDMENWMLTDILVPLNEDANARRSIERMFKSLIKYYQFGERRCLLDVATIGNIEETIGRRVAVLCIAWRDALETALLRIGWERADARRLAESALATIQGGLVLSGTLDDRLLFVRLLNELEDEMLGAIRSSAQSSHARA